MNIAKNILFSIIIGSITSLIFSILSSFPFGDVFWGTWLFTSLGYLVLLLLFNYFRGDKFIGILLVLSLFLRLGLGLVTTYNLIDWGYDQEPYTSGYLFKDAYNRDLQAWELANSDQPIFSAFSNDFISDQYGGLLASSALIYRLFTGGSHLQINIIFFVTLISTLGLLFLYESFKEKSNKKVLLPVHKLILMIFAFYPDAILFSSSQMREPLLIGLSACLFWVATRNSFSQKKRFLLFSVFSFFLLLVSLKIGIFIIFSFLLWVVLQPYSQKIPILSSKIIYLPVAIFMIIAAYFSYNWVIEAGKWDALVLEQRSGFVQYIVSIIGAKYRLPFAATYGLFQPVLPAALVEPSKLFWRFLQSFRALGWYLIAPSLVYGIVYFIREKNKEKKIQFGLLWTLSIFWIILSSIRAGGDMWDNPRYRLGFLIFIVYVVGIAVWYGWKNKDHWLVRIYIAELVFVLFFLQWYISRYTGIFENLSFLQMVVVLSILFALILISGIVTEIKNLRQKKIFKNNHS